MTPFPPFFRPRAAFSLIEVLVALTLMSLVLALAALLLSTSGRVTDSIAAPRPRHALDTVLRLGQDLDRLLRAPLPDDETGLRLDAEEGLSFPLLLETPTQGLRHHRVAYLWNADGELRRLLWDSATDLTSTNILLRGFTRFRLVAREEGQDFETWPPENRNEPPRLLRVDLEIPGEAPLLRDLALPAAFRHSPPSPTETP